MQHATTIICVIYQKRFSTTQASQNIKYKTGHDAM